MLHSRGVERQSENPTYSANLCEVVESLATAFLSGDTRPKAPDCSFHANLVAIFEAVRHGLGDAVYAHGNATNSRVDHTLCQRISGKTNEPQWQALHTRFSGLAINGHPDLV